MSRRTVSLAEARPEAAQLGGKGASLVRLVALGLDVPEAFVIDADAYREHLARPAVREKLGGDRAALMAAIAQEPIDEGLAEEISARLSALGEGPLAVRSSAIAEDSAERSFAGQHETVLGVVGAGECLAAVRRCWASAWSPRAVEYRTRAGLAHEAAAMAVVVQRLVPAQWAGVLFTRDPASAAEQMVCEAVQGLGEPLVSGRVSPSRWLISRKDLSILASSPGTQAAALFATAGGTREQPVAGERELAEATLRRVAEIGRRVEEAFGAPQDIEWALAGGTVHVLQARPITTKLPPAPPPSPEDRVVWSNTNLGELLPEVATPMTFAIARRFVDELIGSLAARLGFDLRRLPLVGLVAGRLYANMNSVAALLRRMPGMRRRSYADYFGGDQVALREAMAGLRDEDLPQTGVNPWRVALRMPGFFWWVVSRAFRPLPGWVEGFLEQIPPLGADETRALPDHEISDRIEELMSFMSGADRSDGMAYALVATGSTRWLAGVCRRWLNDLDGSLCNRLLTGLGGVSSAEAGLELFRLADSARELGLGPVVRSATSFAALRAGLEPAPQGAEWLRRWDAFICLHGHHAMGELDVAVARWAEQPDYLLGMVRGYLEAPPDASPLSLHARRAAERETLERECRAKLGPLRRRIFDGLLVRAQVGVTSREGAKSGFIRRLARVRALLLEAGRRLIERGLAERSEDVFFLDLEELPRALAGGIPDFKTVAARRRAELEAYRTFRLPPVLVGRFDPSRHAQPPPPGARVLKGLSVSPGLVEGPARVILAASSGERVLPGEILVAPFTDPGWTPYFLTAAAIVMDMGGVLSHGAVVAREYGIPAVVNVGPATRCIRTGQRIRVDAFRGEVRILE